VAFRAFGGQSSMTALMSLMNGNLLWEKENYITLIN